MKKRLLVSVLMSAVALMSMAQVSNTLSPYSQFGLGVLSDQSQGFNRGMNGLSLGVRDSKVVNIQNPASYSAVDSLTMVFDMGMSGQVTNFKEGGKKLNSHTSDFDYAVALFRLLPKLGMSLGVVPFSNIGYKYSNTENIGTSTTTAVTTYTGSGGFSQAFLGLGWNAGKGFSVGANLSYFWGKYEKTVSIVNSDAYVNTTTKTYSATVNSYKLDLGAQWQHELNKDDQLIVGATLGIGHKLGAGAHLQSVNTDPQTGVATTTNDTVSNAFSLPFTIGLGVTLLHKRSLMVGADYTMQKWGSLDYPMQTDKETAAHPLGYALVGGQLKNRHKLTLGLDWIPNPNVMVRSSFLSRIHYRMGASYATPYYKIGGQNGPHELSVSAGFGIPITNSWNNRSVLNISAQWVNTAASQFIKENTFRINIGLTFNERWFAKWKVD